MFVETFARAKDGGKKERVYYFVVVKEREKTWAIVIEIVLEEFENISKT